MTVIVAMPITVTLNGLCEADMFAFLSVDRHGTGSVLFKLYHRIYIYIYMYIYIFIYMYILCMSYIFTTGYICRYMRRNLAPLGCHFNNNRNGSIVELSCLYCHLFYLL